MDGFLRNCWYVGAWSHDLTADTPLARQIIGEPVVLFRTGDGSAHALEDRCPHRHAPLSMGRIEGDTLRCMYHGLLLSADGHCLSVPGADAIPRNCSARRFPVVERDGWLWIWMGDAAAADPATVPEALGIDDPRWTMRAGQMEYAADYQLINDNLTDLSHLDFVHETTLGAATGSRWSDHQPRVTVLDQGLLVERWFTDHVRVPGSDERTDTFNSYRYLIPGVFVMTTRAYPEGTAERCGRQRPDGIAHLFERVEQQAVTPIGPGRSRYLYASGVGSQYATPELMDGMMHVVNAAFNEDRAMIEGQQRIWDLTPRDRAKVFIPQDKAPAIFRRMIARRLEAEQAAVTPRPDRPPAGRSAPAAIGEAAPAG